MKKLLLALTMLLTLNVHAQDKNWNLRFEPISWLVGATNVELNYAVGSNFTIGGGLVAWNVELLDIEIGLNEYHVRGDYWFAGAFQQGWYLSGIYSTINMNLQTTDSLGTEYEADVSATGFKFFGGYRWLWENFNLELGYGFVSYNFDDKLTLKASDGSTQEEDLPAVTGTGLEFNMGWTF